MKWIEFTELLNLTLVMLYNFQKQVVVDLEMQDLLLYFYDLSLCGEPTRYVLCLDYQTFMLY